MPTKRSSLWLADKFQTLSLIQTSFHFAILLYFLNLLTKKTFRCLYKVVQREAHGYRLTSQIVYPISDERN